MACHDAGDDKNASTIFFSHSSASSEDSSNTATRKEFVRILDMK